MNTSKIKEFVTIFRSLFPPLPKPKLWEKHNKTRLYFNKRENGADFSFYIDFSSGRPYLGNFKVEEWKEVSISSKKDFMSKLYESWNSCTGVETDKTTTYFTDVFPINTDKIPPLYAYEVTVGKTDISAIGGKLSYQLNNRLAGTWVWTSSRKIITDEKASIDRISEIIEELWKKFPKTYKDLRKIDEISNWKPSSNDIADYIVRGRLRGIERELQRHFQKEAKHLGRVYVRRIAETRAWVVFGEPALSISISSQVVYKDDLKTYYLRYEDSEKIKDLWVVDKISSLKGQISEIVGELKDHRVRLLNLTSRPEMEDLLQRAPAQELVVEVSSGQKSYEYTISALQIIVRSPDYRRLELDSKSIQKHLRISPSIRSSIVSKVRSKIGTFIGDCYDSKSRPELFRDMDLLEFKPVLIFGGDTQIEHNGQTLYNHLLTHGIYKKADSFIDDNTIRVGILDLAQSLGLGSFLNRLSRDLQKLGFQLEIVSQKKMNSPTIPEIESQIKEIWQKSPHIILTISPSFVSEEDGLYDEIKYLTIPKGIPHQNCYDTTLANKFALANILLGILGKNGNIPYVLANPLEFTDLVVGLDIARKAKKTLPGSINITAIARIYFKNGEFLKYVIDDIPIEGETVPASVLQKLFPADVIKGKRVIIHRDGYFRGDEKTALKKWATELNATFYFIEVIKLGAPRLYMSKDADVYRPPKGTAFLLNQREALLVSSLPPFKDATPKPLRIRTAYPMTIKQALISVLSMTLLHYGSLRPPKLPVTIHWSDCIAGLALKGIKPKQLEGTIPYWL
ncbi:MAG: Piwi domain-containing protein [Candidatus Hermodarchaeota archaeon]